MTTAKPYKPKKQKLTWYQHDIDAHKYRIEFDGKFQDRTCIAAKASTKEEEGWIRRITHKNFGFGATKKVDKIYWGKVYIVRVED